MLLTRAQRVALQGHLLQLLQMQVLMQGYKDAIVAGRADDIVYSNLFTGVHGNYLRGSIIAAGLDPDNLPPRGAIDIGQDIDIGARQNRPKRWRDIWSAGQGVGNIHEVLPTGELVATGDGRNGSQWTRLAAAETHRSARQVGDHLGAAGVGFSRQPIGAR